MRQIHNSATLRFKNLNVLAFGLLVNLTAVREEPQKGTASNTIPIILRIINRDIKIIPKSKKIESLDT